MYTYILYIYLKMCKTSLVVQRPRVPALSAGDLGWSLVRELDPECHSEDQRPCMPQLIIKEGCSCTFWPLMFFQAHKQTRLSFMFKKGNYIHMYVSMCMSPCKEDFTKDTQEFVTIVPPLRGIRWQGTSVSRQKMVEEQNREIASLPTNTSETHQGMEQLLQSNL